MRVPRVVLYTTSPSAGESMLSIFVVVILGGKKPLFSLERSRMAEESPAETVSISDMETCALLITVNKIIKQEKVKYFMVKGGFFEYIKVNNICSICQIDLILMRSNNMSGKEAVSAVI
jgi:hypothetical protein